MRTSRPAFMEHRRRIGKRRKQENRLSKSADKLDVISVKLTLIISQLASDSSWFAVDRSDDVSASLRLSTAASEALDVCLSKAPPGGAIVDNRMALPSPVYEVGMKADDQRRSGSE